MNIFRSILCIAASSSVAVVATAASFSDRQGIYTLDIPDGWVAGEESANSNVAVRKVGAPDGGSNITFGILKPEKKTLEENFGGLAAGLPTTNKIDRVVDGAPCISAKIKFMTMPATENPKTPAEDFVFDQLLCSIKVQRNGQAVSSSFTAISYSTGTEYSKHHKIFDALVQSIKWSSDVGAGER